MSDLKMPDINNVLLAGNVSSDPILRKTTNGTPVLNFYLATNRKYKDNSGIWRENLCHVGIVAWQKLAENCYEILKIGSSVLVDGELQSKSWKNDDGSTRSIVEIRARRIQLLEQGAVPAENKEQQAEPQELLEKTPEQPEQQPEQKESSDSEQKIEPTEFDFGYQDLKF